MRPRFVSLEYSINDIKLPPNPSRYPISQALAWFIYFRIRNGWEVLLHAERRKLD